MFEALRKSLNEIIISAKCCGLAAMQYDAIRCRLYVKDLARSTFFHGRKDSSQVISKPHYITICPASKTRHQLVPPPTSIVVKQKARDANVSVEYTVRAS